MEEEPIEECIAALRETAKRHLMGGVLERMRNAGYRFVGVLDGRLMFLKRTNGDGIAHFEKFKTWDDVDVFCKRKESGSDNRNN